MAVSLGDNMYLAGGRAFFGLRFRNDVWRSTNGSLWEKVSDEAPWGARAYHTMTTLGDCMYIVGGQDFRITYNDVWRSCDGANTWEAVTEAAPFAPRCGHAALSLPPSPTAPNGTLLIAGGSVQPHKESRLFFSDVWASYDLGNTWHELVANGSESSFLPCSGPRFVASANGTLYMVAGERGFTTSDQLDSIYRSLDGGRSWALLPSPGWQPRSGHGVVLHNETMYVIGGWLTNTEIAHDLWVWDLDGEWDKVDTTAYGCNSKICARFDFATVIHREVLYLLGGSNGVTTFGRMFDETWAFLL